MFATHVMHEFLEGLGARKFKEAGYERLDDIRPSSGDSDAISVLKAIGDTLADDGLFISLDRLTTTGGTWWYVQCLEEAQMKISLCHSGRITTPDEKFPLTVARRVRPGDRKTKLEEVLSLATVRELLTRVPEDVTLGRFPWADESDSR